MAEKIIIAADPFPPYQYYDETGKVIGIDANLCREVLTDAGYDVEVRLNDWDRVLEMVADGTIDAVFQIAPTAERLEKFYFSEPYRDAYTDIWTADENFRIESYAEISSNEIPVAVIEGYVYGEQVDTLPEEIKIDTKDLVDQLKKVSTGEVKTGVFDRGAAQSKCAEIGVSNLVIIDPLTYSRPMYVMFNNEKKRDDFNKALLNR